MQKPELQKRGVLPPNFDIREFVSPAIFAARGKQAIQNTTLFQFNYAHMLRVFSGGAIVINNYHSGGERVASGTRDRNMKPNGGGAFSTHYHALALDVQSLILNPRQIHELIHDEFNAFFEIGLTTLEDLRFTFPTNGSGRGWTHGDGRMYAAATLLNIERKKKFVIIEP